MCGGRLIRSFVAVGMVFVGVVALGLVAFGVFLGPVGVASLIVSVGAACGKKDKEPFHDVFSGGRP